MTIIKIIRETVKVNPNRGKTQTVVRGSTRTEFKITGRLSLPEGFSDSDFIFISEIGHDPDYICGGIIHPDYIQELQDACVEQSVDFSYTSNFDHEVLYHSPLPKWLFKYENPKIICEECHQNVSINDVNYDYTDDGVKYTVCPKCQEIDTFEEIRYEDINDVVKELGYE